MRQFLSVVIAIIFVIALIINQALPADAAKSSKKKGVSQEVITEMTTKIDNLTNKMYRREFFTPEDESNLSDLKLKLDEQMDIMPEASFAPLYFKIANIYRKRGQKDDAIVCYQTILENFIDTAYGPKSKDILTQMGVKITLPSSSDELDEESGI